MITHDVREAFHSLKEEFHALQRHHIKNEILPKVTEVYITPSECNKTNHNESFLELMDMLGFGRENMASKIVDFAGAQQPFKSKVLNYVHQWTQG
jgi:hypothetical protein